MVTNVVNPKIHRILKNAWKDIENDYRDEKLNSELCLQAALYAALRKILDRYPSYKVLVVPSLKDKNPDLVIRDKKSVQCIIELKFSPHYFIKAAQFKADIKKLILYSESINKKVRLDILGPDYCFDIKTRKWTPQMPTFEVTAQTLYVFGILTRYDDPSGKADLIRRLLDSHLTGQHKFLLLSGLMNPAADADQNRCVFKVEVL